MAGRGYKCLLKCDVGKKLLLHKTAQKASAESSSPEHAAAVTISSLPVFSKGVDMESKPTTAAAAAATAGLVEMGTAIIGVLYVGGCGSEDGKDELGTEPDIRYL